MSEIRSSFPAFEPDRRQLTSSTSRRKAISQRWGVPFVAVDEHFDCSGYAGRDDDSDNAGERS